MTAYINFLLSFIILLLTTVRLFFNKKNRRWFQQQRKRTDEVMNLKDNVKFILSTDWLKLRKRWGLPLWKQAARTLVLLNTASLKSPTLPHPFSGVTVHSRKRRYLCTQTNKRISMFHKFKHGVFANWHYTINQNGGENAEHRWNSKMRSYDTVWGWFRSCTVIC